MVSIYCYSNSVDVPYCLEGVIELSPTQSFVVVVSLLYMPRDCTSFCLFEEEEVLVWQMNKCTVKILTGT